jgi:hypothetical protein
VHPVHVPGTEGARGVRVEPGIDGS